MLYKNVQGLRLGWIGEIPNLITLAQFIQRSHQDGILCTRPCEVACLTQVAGHQLLLYLVVSVTMHCTMDGQFLLVISRDVTIPSINLDSISILEATGGPCTAVDSNDDFALYQFPVTACGARMKVWLNTEPKYSCSPKYCNMSLNVNMRPWVKGCHCWVSSHQYLISMPCPVNPLKCFLQVEGDYIVYENTMASLYEVGIGPHGAITREGSFEWVVMMYWS